MSANQNKKLSLENKLKQAKALVPNIEDYVADSDKDLPDFGAVAIYDYQKDIDDAKVIAKNLLDNLADLYFKEQPEIKDHEYIKARIKEDADYYAQMKVLQSFAQKILIDQMKQIDSGDNSVKMYETVTKHMSEVRENIKDGRNARLDIEKMYKEMRKDLGLNAQIENKDYQPNAETDGILTNTTDLNDLIDKQLFDKEERKGRRNSKHDDDDF